MHDAIHNSTCPDSDVNLMFDSILSLLLLDLLDLVGLETAIYYLLSGFPCDKTVELINNFYFSCNSVDTFL